MAYLGSKPQSGFISNAKERYTGITTAYVDLNHSIASLADVIVWVNYVKQDATNLTLTSSTRITLGATLVASDIVEIAYLGKAVATQNPSTNSVTNDMLAGSIANSKLANSSITLNGSAVSLGGSATVGGTNTPSFLATLSSDTNISDDTTTLIPANNEVFDTDNAYNNSTYKFTPQTAGKYFVFAFAQINASSGQGGDMAVYIFKNGSNIHNSELSTKDGSTSRLSATVSAIVDMNGSSDYIQGYVVGNVISGTPQLKSDSNTKTRFGAFRIIT